MITNDVSTLKIHKLTQEQYDRELAAGRLDENALYLTPDGDIEISDVVGLQEFVDSHTHVKLTNSQGAVVSLLNTGEGNNNYMLVPKEASASDYYRVYLGTANAPYQGLYTNFVVSNGVIQADSGNILAKGANSIIQGENQIYAKKTLTSDGTLAVAGETTLTGMTTVSARIQPYASSQVNLGYSDKRWMNIYSNANVNVSSDLNVKTDIVEIDDRYIELFDLVQPYAYKFIDGTSGRVHTGFISQYVEDAMEKVGLTAKELAFFCKDIMTEPVYDEDGNFIEDKELIDEDGNPVYYYSLRYGEYVAIMTEKIKRMEKRIDELETKLEKVDEIEARLATIENA